jgi:hypothetical protein
MRAFPGSKILSRHLHGFDSYYCVEALRRHKGVAWHINDHDGRKRWIRRFHDGSEPERATAAKATANVTCDGLDDAKAVENGRHAMPPGRHPA